MTKNQMTKTSNIQTKPEQTNPAKKNKQAKQTNTAKQTNPTRHTRPDRHHTAKMRDANHRHGGMRETIEKAGSECLDRG